MFVGVTRAEGIRAYHYSLLSFTSIAEQQKRGWRPNRDHRITFDVEASALGGVKGSEFPFVDASLAIDEDKGTAILIVDATLVSTVR
jgi:hypothetical protein